MAKGVPLGPGKLSKVIQGKGKGAGGRVGKGGKENISVFQRHHQEKHPGHGPCGSSHCSRQCISRFPVHGVPVRPPCGLILFQALVIKIKGHGGRRNHQDTDGGGPSQIGCGDHLGVRLCGQDLKISSNDDGRSKVCQVHGKQGEQHRKDPRLTNGRITENSVFSGEAPRSLDARTSLWSIWSKDGSSIRDAKEMLPIIWRITMPCHPRG